MSDDWKEQKKRQKAIFTAQQNLPYEVKVRRAELRAREFIQELDRRGMNAHVSVGGLDSIVLMMFLRKIGINVPAVSVSCGVWFDRVLEDVQDAMYSDYGDNAEDWDLSVGDIEERQEIYDKYEEKLTDLVEDYIKEIGAKPNFYDVVDIKPIIIE